MDSRNEPLDTINFVCGDCRHKFCAEPDKALDDVSRPWHPYEYFANCEECGYLAEQAWWEKNLIKAQSNATGPKTAEGKLAVTQNLAGHPTSEEAKRTRFNAMKHGAFASTATYFPAKPGKYPQCSNCEYLNNGCDEYPKGGYKNPPACLKRTELFLKHQVAFETGDVKMLTGLRADTQAALQAILQDMILAVASDGSALRTPEWYHDKDGGFHLAQYKNNETGEMVQLEKVEEHPLLKRVIDMVSKNNLTLADMGMTPKVQEDRELIEGQLSGDKQDKESLLDYTERQAVAMEGMKQMIANSMERVQADPIYVELKEQNDG